MQRHPAHPPPGPEQQLRPFRAELVPPAAYHLARDRVHEITVEETTTEIHPDLEPVPVWGYG